MSATKKSKAMKKAALSGLLKYKQTLINSRNNEQNEPQKKR